MKKSKLIRLTSILLMLGFSALNLTAVVSEENLEIKAYKNYSAENGDFMAVYITDAITSSLSLILESRENFNASGKPQNLDITPYVEKQLLGDIANPNISEENIAFSYRVVGNQICHYTLELSIEPFIQQVESTSEYRINAYYEKLNENAVFQATSSDESIDNWHVYLTSLSSSGSTSSSNNAYIKAEWTVEDAYGQSHHDNKGNPSEDMWIIRGAVAVVIDREDYAGAPNGDYKAYCTVKVTHD